MFFKALIIGDPVPGFPTLMVMIAFIGGNQLIVLGVIVEYLAGYLMIRSGEHYISFRI